METRPVRLQLSRKKGFDLQALSLATNGLECAVVARPVRWGNPFDFRRAHYGWIALSHGCRGDAAGRQEASVRALRAWVDPPFGRRTLSHEEQPKIALPGGEVPLGPPISAGEAPSVADIRAALRGKNLACWCAPGAPCHADVLLEIANAEKSDS